MNNQSVQCAIAFIVVVFGIVLITAAFIAPPMGEISPTVLTAFGEALTFSGALLGIDYAYRERPPTSKN